MDPRRSLREADGAAERASHYEPGENRSAARRAISGPRNWSAETAWTLYGSWTCGRCYQRNVYRVHREGRAGRRGRAGRNRGGRVAGWRGGRKQPWNGKRRCDGIERGGTRKGSKPRKAKHGVWRVCYLHLPPDRRGAGNPVWTSGEEL